MPCVAANTRRWLYADRTGVHRACLEQGADLVQRRPQVSVGLAVHGHRPRGRPIQPEDHPHGRRLARTVRAEKTGDNPRSHREIEPVDRHLVAVPLAQAVRLDHREPATSVTPPTVRSVAARRIVRRADLSPTGVRPRDDTQRAAARHRLPRPSRQSRPALNVLREFVGETLLPAGLRPSIGTVADCLLTGWDGAAGALSVRRAELPGQAGSAGGTTVSGAVLDAAPDAAIGAAPAGSPPVAVAARTCRAHAWPGWRNSRRPRWTWPGRIRPGRS